MHKLDLAGRGDIRRLTDRIDELRKEFQLVDDRGDQQIPQALTQRAQDLGVAVGSGPFDDRSVFAKTLRQILNSDQRLLYESYRELERLGGKIHLRPCGEREIKAIRMTDAALT